MSITIRTRGGVADGAARRRGCPGWAWRPGAWPRLRSARPEAAPAPGDRKVGVAAEAETDTPLDLTLTVSRQFVLYSTNCEACGFHINPN